MADTELRWHQRLEGLQRALALIRGQFAPALLDLAFSAPHGCSAALAGALEEPEARRSAPSHRHGGPAMAARPRHP